MGVRGRLFSSVLGLVAGGQLLALLDAVGLRVPAPGVGFSAAALLCFGLGALFPRPPVAERDARGWWWMALLAWGSWAGLYYLTAFATAGRPAVTLLLPGENTLPASPPWVLVYLGVHPFSLLPFFALQGKYLKFHTAGQLAIVAVSVACWWLIPATMPREPLPEDPGSIGRWALLQMRGSDPASNCLPSTHCAVSLFAALALKDLGAGFRAWSIGTFVAIVLSTLFTRQHALLDVLAGVALGYLAHKLRLRHAATPSPSH